MTQPNPSGDGTTVPQPTNSQPTAPATGTPPAQPTTTPPPPPGFVPATGTDTTAEDQAAQQMLAAAAQQGGDPNSATPGADLGDAGKRALAAERERAKKAEAATREQAKQLETLQEQLKALQPAADIFAQLRKAAVPEAEKTDTERLQEELAKLREETQGERVQRWRLEIATDKGLSREQAAELRGSSQEELAAHADRLLALFPQAPTPPAPAPTPDDPAGNGRPQPDGQRPAAPPAAPRPDPSQGARGPVDLHAQIQDALAKGDVRTSIALKQQLRAAQTQ